MMASIIANIIFIASVLTPIIAILALIDMVRLDDLRLRIMVRALVFSTIAWNLMSYYFQASWLCSACGSQSMAVSISHPCAS